MAEILDMPRIDLEMARRFLAALGDHHVFQVFSDQIDNAARIASVFEGTIDSHAFADTELTLGDHFRTLNTESSCGIHVTINECRGAGRKREDVVRPRAIAMDFDGIRNPRGAGALAPSMVVLSRRGPHVYWLLDAENDLDRWSRCQKALARKLEADLECAAYNKTMRIPGFLHHKQDPPFFVRLEVYKPLLRYTIDDIVHAWGLDLTPKPPPKPIASIGRIGHDRRIERCRAYVARCEGAVSGQGGYSRTKGVCGIGGDFGLDPDEFWPILLEWNDRCVPPWKESELRRKLERVHECRTDPIGKLLEDDPERWPKTIKREGPRPEDIPGPITRLFREGPTEHLDAPMPPSTEPPVPPPTDSDAPPAKIRAAERPPPPTDDDAPAHLRIAPSAGFANDGSAAALGDASPKASEDPSPPPEDADPPPPTKPPGGGGDGGSGEPPRPPLRLVGTAADGMVMSDMGNAHRFVQYTNKIDSPVAHCELWGKWLYWDQYRWRVDTENHVRALMEATIASLHGWERLEPPPDKDKFINFVKKSEGAKGFDHALAQAKHLVAVSPDRLDQDPWLFNVANGTLDLRTGTLQKPDRSDWITKQSPIPYLPRDECETPLWDDYLDMVTGGDVKLQRYLQIAAGYTLTGLISEQCFFLLYGRGKNGKSTFLEVLQMMMGRDYAQTSPMDSFLERRYEAIRNDLAAMKGKRFVSASETNESQQLDEALVKSITGGEDISARFMRGEFFQYKPQFKLWLSFNEKPVIRGDDEGIWRRIRLVPFAHSIPAEKRKLDFPRELVDAGELPGVLRWAVEGCSMWLREGKIAEAPVVAEATAEYRAEQDTMGTWLDERCVLKPDIETNSRALYDDYKEWMKDSGKRPLGMTKFSGKLRDRGFERKRQKRGTVFYGLGLLIRPDGSSLF